MAVRNLSCQKNPEPCLTTVTWRCCKNFSQWECRFLWKLHSHWLKGFWQKQIAVVRQGPVMHILYQNRWYKQKTGLTAKTLHKTDNHLFLRNAHHISIAVKYLHIITWLSQVSCEIMPPPLNYVHITKVIKYIKNTTYKIHPILCPQLVSRDLAPFPLMIFPSNSKFNQSLPFSALRYTRPITTKFCTRHDSVTVVTCAQFLCDRLSLF